MSEVQAVSAAGDELLGRQGVERQAVRGTLGKPGIEVGGEADQSNIKAGAAIADAKLLGTDSGGFGNMLARGEKYCRDK